uniref:Acyl-CoA synthetase family member 4-like n=1 Tax=Hirondellea gigas TaxID=1518452 RepID=A0A6A7GED1_9CRUS
MSTAKDLATLGLSECLMKSLQQSTGVAITHISGSSDVSSVPYAELLNAVMETRKVLRKLRKLTGLNHKSSATAATDGVVAPIILTVCVETGIPCVALILAALLERHAYMYVDPAKRRTDANHNIVSIVKPDYFIMEETDVVECTWQCGERLSECINIFNTNFCIIPSHEKSFNPLQSKDELAYIVTTTGTTGHPKIVYVPYRCVLPNVTDLCYKFEVQSSDVIFSAAPLSFDPSIVNILMCLLSGAELVLVSTGTLCSSSNTVSNLLDRRVSIIQVTPSLLSLWNCQSHLSNTLFGCNSPVKFVILGGEPLPSLKTLRYWLSQSSQIQLYSLYGITEVSAWASIKKIILHTEIRLACFHEHDYDVFKIKTSISSNKIGAATNDETYLCNKAKVSPDNNPNHKKIELNNKTLLISETESKNDLTSVLCFSSDDAERFLNKLCLSNTELGELLSETAMCVVNEGQPISEGTG